MKLLLLNHIQNARDSLRANRTRTILTITGVTIGIMSIVAILALAGGANSIVKQQVDNLGGNLAVIRPGGITSAYSDYRLLLFLLRALLLYRPAHKRSNAVLDLKMIASSLKNIFLYN